MNRYNKNETSLPLSGAAYIRYSSEMQSDSFSLDAQLRQIREQAERDQGRDRQSLLRPGPIGLSQEIPPWDQRHARSCPERRVPSPLRS